MQFIESLDTQQSPPPFFFPGMVIRNFLLAADPVKLQQYCDRCLNILPDRRFEVIAPLVYLSVNTYPQMFLKDMEDLGSTSQNEYLFMLPVLRFDAVGWFLLPSELTWIFPFIGVDNSGSAIAGQTVLGFPKLCGTIDLQTAPDDSFSAQVAMPGFKTLTKTSVQELLPIVTVDTGLPLGTTVADAAAQGLGFPWSLFDQPDVRNILDTTILDLLDAIPTTPGLFSVTTLKQIRSAVDPDQAEIQQILRGEWQLSNIKPPVVWDGADVTIRDNATTRIAETLGLVGVDEPGGQRRLSALAAFSLTSDMTFDNFTS